MKPKMDASEYLDEIARLLTLAGESPFRVRAFQRASEAVAGRDDLDVLARGGALTTIDGVGKGIAEVLGELFLKGSTQALDEIREKLPRGLEELTQVSGVGPKKARTLIEKLEIHTIAELEYACRENRLVDLPGFGQKAQAKIMEGVLYLRSNQGKRLFADCESLAGDCLA
ncbi:MAG: helix-hairpin-helix domain-containing protein, partial [Bdellovibrionota bacterium]